MSEDVSAAPAATIDAAKGVAENKATAPLWNVQYLRAAAAMMVIYGHAQSMVASIAAGAGTGFMRSTLLPWGAGVDLFFVISGFIMVYASRRLFATPGARGAFLNRRLARIIPLYWVATSLYLALLAAAAWKGGDALPSGQAVLASYLFLPFETHPSSGVFPVLTLGWTLNYEMFFYAVFALAISLSYRAAAGVTAAMLVVLTLAGTLVSETQVALHFWTRPILLNFALGLGIGVIALEGARLSATVRLVLVLLGSAALAADPMHVFNGPLGSTTENGFARVIFAGVPAAALLAGAALGPQPRLSTWNTPLGRLGDASYSLYLLHAFALIAMEKALQKLPMFRELPGELLVLATVASAILIAFAAYYGFERPFTAALNARTNRGKHGRPTASSNLQEIPR